MATPDESPREEACALSQDLHSRRVGDRTSYVGKPKNRVTKGRGEVDGRLTAYVYYSDAEDAVGYIGLRSAGSRAANAALAWSRLFRDLFERGLSPTEAIAEVGAGEGAGDGRGHLVSGSFTETAGSYLALKLLAAE